MACYNPIPAYRNGPQGDIVLWPELHLENMELPCGRCIGCRTDRAVEWGHRAQHEAAQFAHNTFITLTYDEENLPHNAHLRPTDLTTFLKRLRIHANRHWDRIDSDRNHNIRYLACGEYGGKTARPHYHACLFNAGFNDGQRFNAKEYTSPTLTALWGLGIATYGTFTPAGATYVAKYSLKRDSRHWSDQDGYADEYGEWHPKPQPFLRVSVRPAIGRDWLSHHHRDLQHGYLVANGRKVKIPRYYLKHLATIYNVSRGTTYAEDIQYNAQTRRMQEGPSEHNTPERRKAAHTIHLLRQAQHDRQTKL